MLAGLCESPDERVARDAQQYTQVLLGRLLRDVLDNRQLTQR